MFVECGADTRHASPINAPEGRKNNGAFFATIYKIEPVNRLKIYVDLAAPADALAALRQGVGGHELIFAHRPGSSVLSKAAPDPQILRADAVFGQPDPKGIIGALGLKWVQISSSGITRYDNAHFRALMAERRIAVCNSASVYNEPCAVHLLSFMLAQGRNLPLALKSRAVSGTEDWTTLRNTSSTLQGETVLMVGFGAIARRLVELLRPFAAKIVACRRTARGDEPVPIVDPEQLPAVLGQADHVLNILPDSTETRHFFNAARFAAMKRGAVFYNIGRGATVDQEALLAALRSGQIKAAWLDVTEPEPLPDGHPLRGAANCFITPHVAGGHPNEAVSLVQHFLRNLERFERGEPFIDRVM